MPVGPGGCLAVIATGGLGSRMGDLGVMWPKALLPVGGAPAIEHVLSEIQRVGVEEIQYTLFSPQSEYVAEYLSMTSRRRSIQPTPVRCENPWIACRGAANSEVTLVFANSDELCGGGISRALWLASKRFDCPAIGILDPDADALTVERLVDLQSKKPTPNEPLEKGRRFIGRAAFPSWFVSECDCETADPLLAVRAWSRRRPVVAVRWPGPYVDFGTWSQYRALWKPELSWLDP